MIKPKTFEPLNILGEGSGPDWKVFRYTFAGVTGIAIADMRPGYLLKFNAAGSQVSPAVAADDAALGGILVDMPEPDENQTTPTVAVAVQGTFNRNQIHYADWDPEAPAPLSGGALERLRTLNIFLDPAVPAGPFAP